MSDQAGVEQRTADARVHVSKDGVDDDRELVTRIARSLISIPGVLRLEPRLKDFLRRGDPTRFLRSSETKLPEGIDITSIGAIRDVTVDLAISSSSQALATALSAREAIQRSVASSGREPGRIVVNILAVEHDGQPSAG